MSGRSIAVLIVAAGSGVRAGAGLPKQYRTVSGRSVLHHAVTAFAGHAAVGNVRVVINPADRDLYDAAVTGLALPTPVAGGATRQDSVRLGLEALAADAPDLVLIHDAARPFVTAGMIERVIAALETSLGATPALPVVDSLRSGDGFVESEVPREHLHRVQTPQGFDFAAILAAHRAAAPGATDDVAVLRAAGHAVALVDGDERAFKLTTAEDFDRAEALLMPQMISRTGQGFDVHRFGEGDHLWLCGLKIEHSQGLVGHSDADVGLHALTDALLGTIGAGDIGTHFPPSDPQWKGAASNQFLRHARALVGAAGGIIDHVDLTIIAERPKVGPHRAAMVATIAALLDLPARAVSIKATTTEGLGFTGRGEGIAAQALASVRLPR